MIDNPSPEIPPRCTLHQVIKGNAYDVSNPHKHCYICKYYTRNLDSSTCKPCLRSEHLDNFVIDRFIAEDPNWEWYRAKLNEKEKKQ